ncbi:hypothetical protein FKW77_004065 [Venturia effusa]|uniref:Uncharacterized protein n=1 Tax=Venturia effusa TaxID=50376 RepID=A0A517KZB7_9PEZI|nr:hypothetical protein FKW77_004065 [Venturia effusa]
MEPNTPFQTLYDALEAKYRQLNERREANELRKREAEDRAKTIGQSIDCANRENVSDTAERKRLSAIEKDAETKFDQAHAKKEKTEANLEELRNTYKAEIEDAKGAANNLSAAKRELNAITAKIALRDVQTNNKTREQEEIDDILEEVQTEKEDIERDLAYANQEAEDMAGKAKDEAKRFSDQRSRLEALRCGLPALKNEKKKRQNIEEEL